MACPARRDRLDKTLPAISLLTAPITDRFISYFSHAEKAKKSISVLSRVTFNNMYSTSWIAFTFRRLSHCEAIETQPCSHPIWFFRPVRGCTKYRFVFSSHHCLQLDRESFFSSSCLELSAKRCLGEALLKVFSSIFVWMNAPVT